MTIEKNTILQGDCLEVLKTLPDESVDCCITSPPYWGLRDYGTAKWEGGNTECKHLVRENGVESTIMSGLQGGKKTTGHQQEGFKNACPRCGAVRIDSQLGLEKTPEEYVAKLVLIFREVRRVLKKAGTLWLNLGDSYAGGSGCHSGGSEKQQSNSGATNSYIPQKNGMGLKPKDLCGIPWRVAFALQADGWWLRQDIIWAKPNPMPESCTDRCTKSHEYVFLMTKSAHYYYDHEAIKEECDTDNPLSASYRENGKSDSRIKDKIGGKPAFGADGFWKSSNGKRNKRSVWTIPTQSFPDAHFATFPEKLVEPMVLAGCPEWVCPKCGKARERIVEKTQYAPEVVEIGVRNVDDSRCDKTRKLSGKEYNEQAKTQTVGWSDCGCGAGFKSGICLDPFGGACTTALVAYKNNRDYVMIELNPKYIEMAEKRLRAETDKLGLFAQNKT